jgi:multiple sugar transport system substrate-binding protein
VKKSLALLAGIMAVAVMVSACSGGGSTAVENDSPGGTTNPPTEGGKSEPAPKDEPAPATFSTDPVTLKIYAHGNVKEEKFNKDIKDPVTKALPHITIEFMKGTVEGVNYADMVDGYSALVTSGDIPDLIMGGGFHAVNFGLVTDLNPLVKQFNIDLSQVNEAVMNDIQGLSLGDELYELPTSGNFPTALFYNKDLFDKFAIDYPKDGLFYDEYAELVAKIARTEDGVNYRGGNLDNANRIISQLSLPYVNPETNEPAFLTDPKWTTFMNFWKQFNEIPNNNLIEDGGNDGFTKSQTIAMRPYGIGFANAVHKAAQESGMNWDIAAYPTFREAPGVAPFVGGSAIVMTPSAKNREAAFQVMTYLAFDEEFNLQRSREGIPSPLNLQVMKDNFAADSEALKGKHVEAIFFNPHEGSNKETLYGSGASAIAFRQAMVPIRDEGMDVVEALRLADEALRQQIAIEMEARPPQ